MGEAHGEDQHDGPDGVRMLRVAAAAMLPLYHGRRLLPGGRLFRDEADLRELHEDGPAGRGFRTLEGVAPDFLSGPSAGTPEVRGYIRGGVLRHRGLPAGCHELLLRFLEPTGELLRVSAILGLAPTSDAHRFLRIATNETGDQPQCIHCGAWHGWNDVSTCIIYDDIRRDQQRGVWPRQRPTLHFIGADGHWHGQHYCGWCGTPTSGVFWAGDHDAAWPQAWYGGGESTAGAGDIGPIVFDDSSSDGGWSEWSADLSTTTGGDGGDPDDDIDGE